MEFRNPASFRDPSGFVFTKNGLTYRHVNKVFSLDFEAFHEGGLYQSLIQRRLLLSHKQINENISGSDNWYSTLKPDQLRYLSYPFEWSFDMLKDAALVTLAAAKEAIRFKMILKDASAYNVQFHKGAMTLIDSLSFERYDGRSPWIAYRQFCEHFLAPLVCMHYLKAPVNQFFFAGMDGIPVALAKKMLPWKSKINLNVALHIHLHANVTNKKHLDRHKTSFGIAKLKQLYRSLEETIRFCENSFAPTTWSNYSEEVSLREYYLKSKKEVIAEWILNLPVKTAVDVGANDGMFSEILASQNIYTISVDSDPTAINNLYKGVKNSGSEIIHPLLINLDNPTPGFGFGNNERTSFIQRTKVDLVLALAVVHHLAIGKNVPFDLISKFLSQLGKFLIIEFVPKEDPKIKLMLEGRKDIFFGYDEKHFLNAFGAHYKVLNSVEIGNSKRKLFLMELL